MSDKHSTPPEVDRSFKGQPDGVNQAEGQGQSGGGATPREYTQGKSGRSEQDLDGHGGQSVMGYHGPQQLGDQEIKPGGNENAGSKTE